MNDLRKIKCFLFDLDGTVYLGKNLIDGALETVEFLRKRAKVCFLTNNSSKSKKEYLQKLFNFGLNPKEDELITSTDAAVHYLKHYHAGKAVYFVGTENVREELLTQGLPLTSSNPEIVLLSYDTSLTYKKLCEISLHLKRGAFYIATHPDITCPAEEVYLPDIGSFMELIFAATGRRADVICGKPTKILADVVTEKFNLTPQEIAMCGDREMTDIRFAKDNGFTSILVLTGETQKNHVTSNPDYTFESICGIKRALSSNPT